MAFTGIPFHISTYRLGQEEPRPLFNQSPNGGLIIYQVYYEPYCSIVTTVGQSGQWSFFQSSLSLSSLSRWRFTLDDLLDKPWSQVSDLLPPDTCL